jgi:site-specific recombinase
MIITFDTIFLVSISVAGQQPTTPAAAPAERLQF